MFNAPTPADVCLRQADGAPVSKTNQWSNEFLLLAFNNQATGLDGDATGLRGSSTAGVYWISLHTADPGETGTQTTSEIAYTGYARVSVNRAAGAGGFNVADGVASFASNVEFPLGIGGSGTATHWGIGTSQTGAGKLRWKGLLNPVVVCGNGVRPLILAGQVVTET